MRDDEPLELTDDLALLPEREPALDQFLERTEAQLLESHRFGACPLQVRHTLERAPAPERERIGQHLDALLDARSRRRRRDGCHEGDRVDDAVVRADARSRVVGP